MAARAGERLRVSGTSLTGNRTSELPSVAAGEVKRGRPGAGSADRGFVLGVLQRRGGGVVKPKSPRDVPLVPRSPRVASSPSSLPSSEVKGAGPREPLEEAVVAAEPGGGRRAAGRPAAARPASSRALEPPARAGPSGGGGGGGRRGRA
uniref:translation initiation factor IF-2-like n=1 Tax=Arvicanthis niloticus TaxID=61156 RepID=UPI0014873546|nr:translation initiation factor IF-2-like [Arvicanthis niloticus]